MRPMPTFGGMANGGVQLVPWRAVGGTIEQLAAHLSAAVEMLE